MKQKPTLIAVGPGCSSPKALNRIEEIEYYYKQTEVDVLARTLWGEARGEGTAGMQAVAHVILNRVKIAQEKTKVESFGTSEQERKKSYWWGNNVIQVCQKPYQFSCWNRSDPNFRKLQALTEKDLYFATALRIARRVLIGATDDPTGGATHYHANNITPYWAVGEKPSAIIGRHIFYSLV